MSRLNHDPTQERDALKSAKRVRAEYLVNLSRGALTMQDVILATCTPAGTQLSAVTLRQLVSSQRGWGELRSETFLSAVAERLAFKGDVGDMTIGWLIDSRSRRRRFLAFLDAQQKKVTPWPGFPGILDPMSGGAAAGQRAVR